MTSNLLKIELLESGIPSSLAQKYIRDPIHDYIALSPVEQEIVDTPLFQRLRRIFQLQVAYTVYPGATHNRFLHSLGVMHLAGKFALSLIRNTAAFAKQQLETTRSVYVIPPLEDLGLNTEEEQITFLLAARLGGLLHDVGHMPFSHAFDEEIIAGSSAIKEAGIMSHEDTGYYLFKNYFSDIIRQKINSNDDISMKVSESLLLDIVDYIMRPYRNIEKPKEFSYSLARHVVKEFLYPADILDFCIRDAYFTGATEYGRVDVDRLFLFSMGILKNKEEPVIGMMSKALGALRTFLFSRIWLFNNVYFHKYSRLMDYTVKELIREVYREKLLDFDEILVGITRGDIESIEKLSLLDDFNIIYLAYTQGNEKIRELAKRILFRKPLVQEVYAFEITVGVDDIERYSMSEVTFEDVIAIVKDLIASTLNLSEESIIIDSPPIKFFPLNPLLPQGGFPIIEAKRRKLMSIREASAWEISGARISDLAVLRVLIREDDLRESGKTKNEIRALIEKKIIPMKESIKAAFIQKYSKATYTVTM